MKDWDAIFDKRTSARVLRFLGGDETPSTVADSHESVDGGGASPNEDDAIKIAARLLACSKIDEATASATARGLVERASLVMERLRSDEQELTGIDALALESVIMVRGRPALRVENAALESLAKNSGSEFWQLFITDYEDPILTAAAATAAVRVAAFGTGLPEWVQGSAWLVAEDRIVTNRHVLWPDDPRQRLLDGECGQGWQLRPGYKVTVDFAADDREPEDKIKRAVKRVLYVSRPEDEIDIAVLEIEPFEKGVPLRWAEAGTVLPRNVFVVGHPGAMLDIPPNVRTVFGDLDGRKRVSFGKVVPARGQGNHLIHDASTVGGYSGGPLVGIREGLVAGLHFYGDPVRGNLAVKAEAIRTHPSFSFMGNS